MTKEQAEAEQQKLTVQFTELNTKIQQEQAELVRMQGKYELLQNIIDEENQVEPEEAKDE